MSVISRMARDSESISITASAATSGGIPMSSFSGGVLMLDSTSTAADVTLNWYVRESPSGSSAYLLVDKDGAAIYHAIGAGECVELPREAFGARWLIPVINGSGTAAGRLTLKG